MKIEAIISNKGPWVKIQIVSVTEGYSQTLQGGKWINTTSTPQRFEDEVLTLGKYFLDDAEAKQFMNTKPFKSLFRNIEKNWRGFYEKHI